MARSSYAAAARIPPAAAGLDFLLLTRPEIAPRLTEGCDGPEQWRTSFGA